MKVLVAFDHLRLMMSDLSWAYHFVPIYDQVLEEENEAEDDPEESNIVLERPDSRSS